MAADLLPHRNGEVGELIVVYTEPFITTYDAKFDQFLRSLNR